MRRWSVAKSTLVAGAVILISGFFGYVLLREYVIKDPRSTTDHRANAESTAGATPPSTLGVGFIGYSDALDERSFQGTNVGGLSALTYLWDFGDGTAPSETTTPTTSHTYDTAGTYTAELKVRDARGAVSAPATVKVFPGNTPPAPKVESPTESARFKVGEEITLRGSATDPEDGQPPNGALSWEVIVHHGTHTHPYFSGTGNNLTFTAPAPEDLAATENSYLEIRLTATDSQGLSKTIMQELHPRQVNATFDSRPTGLKLQVNGTTFTAPQTFVSWEGYKLNVNAPYPQTLAGTTYVFASWSDGGAQSHPRHRSRACTRLPIRPARSPAPPATTSSTAPRPKT